MNLEEYRLLKLSKTKRTQWKKSWHEFGGRRIFLKSKWEYNYACYLEFLKLRGEIKDWLYEADTFWFEGLRAPTRGVKSFMPDFKVFKNNGIIEYHEVKGWWDKRSLTKVKRMRKYHPDVILLLIDASWFKKNTSKLKNFIPGWC